MYGFAKSQQDNIQAYEGEQFREAAKHVIALDEVRLEALIKRGDFVEVKGE